MMQHPAGLPAGLEGAIGVTSAIQTIEIEYYGKPAHAAAAPCKSESPIVGRSLSVRGRNQCS
jgi:metal-dependent amidase/aminoacylase/carboxypeptidase family protein